MTDVRVDFEGYRKMSTNVIRKIELEKWDEDINCPFCGAKVQDAEAGKSGENPLRPCQHTLFIVHDEGSEHRSERLDQNLGLSAEDYTDGDIPEDGWDSLTDRVTVKGAVKYSCYVPAPSFSGSYFGFAPVEDIES